MANRFPTPHAPRPTSQTLRGLTIGFIGAGTMGQALIKGLVRQGIRRRALIASDASRTTREAVRRQFRIAVTDDNAHVVHRAEIVVLAVKPQQMPVVISSLAPHVRSHHLVISIAAGITLRWLESRLRKVPIIRVMPNLPATVDCGFSAIALGDGALARHRVLATALFRAVGDVVELPERDFDAITAVSGSGPAYVLFLAHAWEEAARSLGLPPAIAARAVRQTLEGSTRLFQMSDEPALTLIKRVASKGGTTEAALRVLARRHVAAHFIEALRAAARRSKQLSMS